MKTYKPFIILTFYCLILLPAKPASAQNPDWQAKAVSTAGNAAILVEDMNGKIIMSHQASTPLIPASIMKVATSYCALSTLPQGFHFPTAFYSVGKTLYVKGYGDPSLTSEELSAISENLRNKGLREIDKIILDDSFFSASIKIDGQSRTLNPYDAHNSALLVNFNTIKVRVTGDKQVLSGEPQTPMTPLTTQMAQGLRPGTHRINLAANPERAVLYAGYLLREFLIQEGLNVKENVSKGKVPTDLKPVYVHLSSKSLEDNVRDLLEYSSNIIANQVFLGMGAHVHGAPANVEKSLNVLRDCLSNKVGWKDFSVAEGSGLSRQNKVTAAQMMQLLRKFSSYENLLPVKDNIFRAKTGSLTGVSSLAGAFTTPNGKKYRFVVIINDPKASYNSKFQVSKIIYNGLS